MPSVKDDDAQGQAPSAAGPRPGCAQRSNWGIFNRRKWGVFVRRRHSVLADCKPKTVIVDKGYRGVAVDDVRILMSGQRRGISKTLKAMIKRRSAIEPAIGHMKMDGRLGRNPLKGALDDAIHAVMCGAGHNLRLILAKLRLLCATFGLPLHQLLALLRNARRSAHVFAV